MHVVERWDALDAPGYQLEHGVALSFLLAGRRSRPLQDLLHGVWLGHPLHPVLVTVPVGSWTVALLLDALDCAGRGGPGTAAAAELSVGLGVAGAVAAAAAGLTDWQHAHDAARRVGLVHATLNSAALGLYAWSLLDRRRGRAGRARSLGAAGFVVTAVSSYLGGTLSYRHRLGVDHSDPRSDPRTFTPVLAVDDLEDGQPRGALADGVPLVLVRNGEQVRAVGGLCPHLGAPLEQGWLHRGELVCPWHGSRFDLDSGEPTQGPSTAPLPCFDARVRDGVVELRRRAPWRSPQAATTREEASR